MRVLGSKQNGCYLSPNSWFCSAFWRMWRWTPSVGLLLGGWRQSLWEGQEAGIPGRITARFPVRHDGCCAPYKYFPHCTDCLFALDYFPDPWRSCSNIFYLSNPTWAFGCLSKGQCLVSCLHSCLLIFPNRFELSTGAGRTQQGEHKWRQWLSLTQSLSATSSAGPMNLSLSTLSWVFLQLDLTSKSLIYFEIAFGYGVR